ncbi:hypothetical protein [Serratia fonticola]|uniref:hypothetical protein n=1 Tax=Serratia fonticola TaxID=47917 RepID=UPI0016460B6B|nr:hypothetical protein [Serratia fonticola]MBC3228338.1 hypothetical protein [Serratia fonticola]
MKHKLLTLGFILLAASSSALAVDGYKGVKFGSTLSDLKAANLCPWKKYESGNFKEIESYYCNDFKFSSKKTFAMAFFINDKFERLAITVPTTDFSAVLDGMKTKYGAPTTMATPEEADSVKLYGGSLSVKFDNDTIILNLSRDNATKEDSAYLIYSSQKYDEFYKQLRDKSVLNDI